MSFRDTHFQTTDYVMFFYQHVDGIKADQITPLLPLVASWKKLVKKLWLVAEWNSFYVTFWSPKNTSF